MARLVFYSGAHSGDVFPYVPVASELSRRGHDVTYVVPREFHPDFEAEPFRAVHSGTDFGPKALHEHGEFLRKWGTRLGGARVLELYFGHFVIPHLDVLYETLDAVVAEGADLLISHPAAAITASMPFEKRGIPWVVPDLFPMLLPTANNAPAGVPNLGPRVNRLIWRAARSPKLDRLSFGGDFKAFRRKIGLPVPDGWNVIDARLSPHHTFAMVSRHYVPTEPDWPDGYRLTGFTPWVGPDGGAIAEDVEAFLADGPPPVLVTLGTLGPSARPEVFTDVARALDDLGERGLFLLSMARPDGIGPPHGVWPFVPLRPLLGRVKAVVQSGSHGTNALTLEAGLPSAIVPCLFDQQWHARRQQELGTGVWVRRPKQLTAAIERVLRDPATAERARLFGNLLATEDGVGNAADEVEAVLARG